MRRLFATIHDGRQASLSAASAADALAFDVQVELTFGGGGAVWPFIIRLIDLGIDWPAWWAPYEEDRARYLSALGEAPPLVNLDLPSKETQAEKWRRYEICRGLGLATCEEAHYPDLFEAPVSIRPAVLDGARAMFPERTFGRFVLASPPRERLIDPWNPGVMNEVWAEERDFLVEHDYLVTGDRIPPEPIVAAAKNASLRDFLQRHGVTASPRRAHNAHATLGVLARSPDAIADFRRAVLPPGQWCRMPPLGLTWPQFQAFRWQVRAIGSTLFDFLEGLKARKGWMTL